MDLPRNITQVGETDRNCKIYVEDYVISYAKQMNKFAEDKEITVALYGKMSVEDQITYCFVYGACAIQSISRDVRHLSQAQNQEVEKMRRKYFPEHTFLGYQILNGEMIEGFRIYDQNSCRYIKGYACFFEKNDSMLAYMLETRREDAVPEVVEQEKYDAARRRQESRRVEFEEKGQNRENRQFKVAPFMFLAGGCLLALVIWGNMDMAKTGEASERGLLSWAQNIREWELLSWMKNVPDQKVEQALEDESVDTLQAVMGNAVTEGSQETSEELRASGTLVTEDKLAEAILEENKKAEENESDSDEQESSGAEEGTATGDSQSNKGEGVSGENQPTGEEDTSGNNRPGEEAAVGNDQPGENELGTENELSGEGEGASGNSQAAGEDEPREPESQESPETPETDDTVRTAYVIRRGDTLIAISKNIYGTDTLVSEICELNQISDPDNIQIGQKILLP